MNPARVDREDERKMLPCRNFLDGYCPRGPRCRFYHPLASSLPTVIRVPNLPTIFQANGGFPVHPGPQAVYSLGPNPSARSHIGISPNTGGFGTSASGSMNNFGTNFGRHVPAPISPSYSEYEMAYAQQMELQKEKERQAATASQPPDMNANQNTMFSHIDWKEFLAPGARPPPPTHVPYMSNGPKGTETLDSLDNLRGGNGNTKIPNPEELGAAKKPARALSAKEELQMKVKQIAEELAAEPDAEKPGNNS